MRTRKDSCMCRLPADMRRVVADLRKRREISRLDPARLEHHPLRHTIVTVILLATLAAAAATFLAHRADTPNCGAPMTTMCARSDAAKKTTTNAYPGAPVKFAESTRANRDRSGRLCPPGIGFPRVAEPALPTRHPGIIRLHGLQRARPARQRDGQHVVTVDQLPTGNGNRP